jgi:hypothetical protein
LLPSDDVFLSVAHQEGGCLLQFPGILEVEFRADEGSLEVTPLEGVSGETVRHLVLDHVLPRLVSHQGRLVLHGAAVADKQGALVLLGPTGAGKSTLAASLTGQGFGFLSDDCVLVQPQARGFRAIPAYPGLRLWADSVSAMQPERSPGSESSPTSWKQRVKIEPRYARKAGVRAVLFLEQLGESEDAAAVSLQPIQGSDALLALLEHGFVLDPTDRSTIERQFLDSGDLADSLPLFRLRYPRDYSRLPEVRQTLLQSLESLKAPC